MARYSVEGEMFEERSLSLVAALERAHRSKERPLCLCQSPGVPMYIAHVGGQYVVKRMPDSGAQHAPACDSYEPPSELSGLGEVMGQAIKEDPESGAVALRLGFALTKHTGRLPPEPGSASDTVMTESKRLTLRAVLHYLWEEAGLNRWSPKMEGRRNWSVVYKYLNRAALGKSAHGLALGRSLFVPEPYFPEHRDAIAQARRARFAALHASAKVPRKLLILVGEVKECTPARFGHKLLIKQLPDCPFMLDDALFKRLQKRFEVELTLWEACPGTHLVAIATFGVGAAEVPAIEAISLMLTTANWIPFESLPEKELIDGLSHRARHFVKCLRYNLAQDRPLAHVVLTDTQPNSTAMYVIDSDSRAQQALATRELASSSRLENWIWDLSAGTMPAFPPATRSAAGHSVSLQQGSHGSGAGHTTSSP